MQTAKTFNYWLTRWVSGIDIKTFHKTFSDPLAMELTTHPAHLISRGGGGMVSRVSDEYRSDTLGKLVSACLPVYKKLLFVALACALGEQRLFSMQV